VAVLERAGLVRKTRRAQQRSCTLEPGRLGEAEEWIAEYRRFFERWFDVLEQQLHRMSDEED
jgi:hypothetical protein